jgi:hypothetical protein
MSQATAKMTAILTNNVATADYTNVWPNTLRADGAITFLSDFYIQNSTESDVMHTFGRGVKVNTRIWNDVYHVRQQNEQSLEAQFVQMFDELCAFLLAQSSDDLALMTLRTAIRRHHLSMATDICKNSKQWPNVAQRLSPLVENW